MDVTRAREHKHGRRQNRRERRNFSNTAGSSRRENSGSGRPMRGGIRL